jgi:hypothetical protein
MLISPLRKLEWLEIELCCGCPANSIMIPFGYYIHESRRALISLSQMQKWPAWHVLVTHRQGDVSFGLRHSLTSMCWKHAQWDDWSAYSQLGWLNSVAIGSHEQEQAGSSILRTSVCQLHSLTVHITQLFLLTVCYSWGFDNLCYWFAQ